MMGSNEALDRESDKVTITRLYVRIEELEHEIGHLKSVLRRIIGYVDSVRSVAGLEEHLGTDA